MRLSELIKIADNAYPDGLVGMAARGRRVGDTLAEFIAVELKETFDKDASTADQLAEAARAIGTAGREITAVHDALENAALDASAKEAVAFVEEEEAHKNKS